MESEELAVVTGYIMFYKLFEGTRLDGTYFSTIDNAILVAKEFIKKYPHDFEWGIEEEFDETLEEFVQNSLTQDLQFYEL